MQNKIIRLPEVKKLTGLSRSTIYLLMGKDKFPKSIPLGYRSIGWIETEIQNWIESRIAEAKQLRTFH